ncbi:hypothetical protein [Herpetosiphon geysericola]|uniref:PrcB C-terminal domain-containing protein n=1 Tax=Herpetosiphon geysericola TaxID=70996 RepID=A0A0P6Z0W5_9CHLR|nr:hypothetical protein [Herpetosiphon geysericola]KPL90572.1 hypothetical protein SE18_05670 [Herpetosiphon geysericola]
MHKMFDVLLLFILLAGCSSQQPVQVLPFTRLADLDDNHGSFDDYPYAEGVLNLRFTQTDYEQTRLLEELPKYKEPFVNREAIQAVDMQTTIIVSVFTSAYGHSGYWVKINEVQRNQLTLTVVVEYHPPSQGQLLTQASPVMSISSIAIDRALLPPTDSLMTIRVVDQQQTEWIRQVYELKPIIE